MGKNAKILHQFVNGLQQELDDNVEKNNSYQKGINGRLYSKNGVLSYSSIQGTVEVYNNPKIVKYLGYWPFLDSLAVFVKHIETVGKLPEDPGYSDTELDIISSDYFEVNIPFNVNQISFLNQIHNNTSIETVTIPVKNPNPNTDDDYDQELSCLSGGPEEINYTDYYTEFPNGNDEACSLELLDETPLNNEDFTDAIYLIYKNKDTGVFTGIKKYEGLLNWDINRKIVTYGLHENNFYQKVYFTDYLNAFRVVNFKDNNLINRLASEFDVFQGGANLSPQIESIEDGGAIKACTVFYTYRLITINGQTTIFAPPSLGLKVEAESSDLLFSGGDVDEITSKKIKIQCNIPDYEKFEEIEAIAVEYSAKNVITSIRNLGTKKVNEVNYFDHVGTESDLSDNINASDVFERVSYWKYCSDLESKRNILFASAIRNEPLPSEILNMSKDFILHSWDAAGNTHDCLINPEPWNYRYFDPANTNDFYYVNKKRYNSIQVFGSYKVTLKNKNNNEEYSQVFILNGDNYVLQTEDIFTWLDLVKDDVDFLINFPNLKFRYENENLFFDPINDNIQTDISNYNLKFNTTQVIQDIDEDVQLINLNIATNNLTYGGVSIGYNRGNGIRVSYNVEQDLSIIKPTSTYPTDSRLINLKAPSMKKSYMKGEIYRLGITFFDLKGAELFVIPIGDIMIPKFGENQKIFIQSTGQVITLGIKYRNSFEQDDKIYAERIVLNVNVRLSCEIMQLVSMYQLMYVPRTEKDRTILCQGISGPMERVNPFTQPNDLGIADSISNKWGLPLQGGPTYDDLGLKQHDIDPYDETKNDFTKRVITHRSLIYFDSPDIIFNKISSNLIKSSSLERISRLNQDIADTKIRTAENFTANVNNAFYSRRIQQDDLKGEINLGKPFMVNFSIFKNISEGIPGEIPITYAEELNDGQIIPGTSFGISQEISNNGITFREQSHYYIQEARKDEYCGGHAKYGMFNLSNACKGYKTVVIKASQDIFSDLFINKTPWTIYNYTNSDFDYPNLKTVDTHALINILVGNRDTVYGGRTEQAYSKNTYKPISDTIPVMKTSTLTQQFYVEGDIYVTPHIRVKSDYTGKNEKAGLDTSYHMGYCGPRDYGATVGTGAWAYAYIVETEVEPRLSSEPNFYSTSRPHDFNEETIEIINEAYFQEYIKNSIPKPFRFKDDPNLFNIISSSKTKLNGEFFDAWTIFPVNNFYEVEKDKGAALNLAKNINDVYVIQENQTSKLIIQPRTMVPTGDGEITIKQTGDGGPISYHDIISNYGTKIRRAAITSDFGFSFVDEKRFEFIKLKKPLLLPNLLGFFLRNLFKEDPIKDTEGYYDDEHKETNILIKSNQNSIMLSYNEAFTVFNGVIDYNNSIYMQWNDDILSPKNDTLPFNGGTRPNESSLHLLNRGNQLNFFGTQKTMKIGVTSHLKASEVLIFKHWAADMNINYAIKEINIKTRLEQTRTITGNHHRYKIREGIHSVPLKNRTDISDLRGKWMYLEVEIESILNSKIDISSFINFVRNSYI